MEQAVIVGKLRGRARQGRGVVYSDLFDANDEKYDLVAFDRVAQAQKILIAASDALTSITVTVIGQLEGPQRGRLNNSIIVEKIVTGDASSEYASIDNGSVSEDELPEGFHPTKGLADRAKGIGYYGEPLTDSHLHDVIERHKIEGLPPYF